ncbi:hypothetical protein JCM10449v2_003472 [Rhodotorula kratochvilovae]
MNGHVLLLDIMADSLRVPASEVAHEIDLLADTSYTSQHQNQRNLIYLRHVEHTRLAAQGQGGLSRETTPLQLLSAITALTCDYAPDKSWLSGLLHRLLVFASLSTPSAPPSSKAFADRALMQVIDYVEFVVRPCDAETGERFLYELAGLIGMDPAEVGSLADEG